MGTVFSETQRSARRNWHEPRPGSRFVVSAPRGARGASPGFPTERGARDPLRLAVSDPAGHVNIILNMNRATGGWMQSWTNSDVLCEMVQALTQASSDHLQKH